MCHRSTSDDQRRRWKEAKCDTENFLPHKSRTYRSIRSQHFTIDMNWRSDDAVRLRILLAPKLVRAKFIYYLFRFLYILSSSTGLLTRRTECETEMVAAVIPFGRSARSRIMIEFIPNRKRLVAVAGCIVRIYSVRRLVEAHLLHRAAHVCCALCALTIDGCVRTVDVHMCSACSHRRTALPRVEHIFISVRWQSDSSESTHLPKRVVPSIVFCTFPARFVIRRRASDER